MIANASHLRSQTGRITIAVSAAAAASEAERSSVAFRRSVFGHQIQNVTYVTREIATIGFGGSNAI